MAASSFFAEVSDAFTGLSNLDNDSTDTVDSYPVSVIGGRNLSFSSGAYQLNNDMIVASTDKLSLTGQLVFGSVGQDELIFISAGVVRLRKELHYLTSQTV